MSHSEKAISFPETVAASHKLHHIVATTVGNLKSTGRVTLYMAESARDEYVAHLKQEPEKTIEWTEDKVMQGVEAVGDTITHRTVPAVIKFACETVKLPKVKARVIEDIKKGETALQTVGDAIGTAVHANVLPVDCLVSEIDAEIKASVAAGELTYRVPKEGFPNWVVDTGLKAFTGAIAYITTDGNVAATLAAMWAVPNIVTNSPRLKTGIKNLTKNKL